MSRPAARIAAALLALAPLAAAPLAGPARADAEQATHADDAATPKTSFDEVVGGVRVRQYQLGCLSQLTYLVVSGEEAAVVDPQRDVGHYLRDAKALGARITHVFLTHTNADFVAGHTELAHLGAKVFISGESGSKFAHEPLRDGQRVTVGKATVEAWATPGHTFDAMVFLLRVDGVTPDPVFVFSGDTLFIGGIGRPDLVGGDATPVRLASASFDSVARLRTLPDATRILPAHGAGSLCGAHLSPETVSTVGREKQANPYLAPMSRAQFVSRVVTGLPHAPPYFAWNARLNREGPPVLTDAPPSPPALAPADFEARRAAGAWVVDLRDAAAYAAGHVEGAVNVAVRGRLDTWTGSVVPFDAPILLVGSDAEVKEAVFRFRRIGLDRVEGYLAGGIATGKGDGPRVRTTTLWSPQRLFAAMRAGEEPVIVDVRTADEHAELRLGDYAHIPLSDWETFGRVLDRKAPVVFVCNSAYRSSMAVGLAERLGFEALGSLEGGLDAWLDAKLPVLGTAAASLCDGPVCPLPPTAPVAASSGGAALLLPEPVAPVSLAAALAAQPDAYAVLDLRPAWAHADYHVPHAVRVEPQAALDHVRRLDPSRRVVFVDADGSVAWAVAGHVAASLPQRALRVLSGGTAAFWRDVELSGPPIPAVGREAQRLPVPAAAPAPPPPSLPPPTPRKRPAGC